MKTLVFLLSFLQGIALAIPVDARTLEFAIGNWEPHTGQSLPNYGAATEIVKAACNAAGLQTVFVIVPWKRAEYFVGRGDYFGTFPYQSTPERKQDFIFSDTLYQTDFGILSNRDTEKTPHSASSSVASLTGLTVGIIAGTEVLKTILTTRGAIVEEVESPKQNILKLAAHRIDIYIDDTAVIRYALTQIDQNMREKLSLQNSSFGPTNNWRIMISKTYPESRELVTRINGGLGRIIKSGQHAEILKRYGWDMNPNRLPSQAALGEELP